MSNQTTYVFGGDRIGLIVRGKQNHGHHPGVLQQHADCILSNGAPVGFFGEGNDGSSNSSGMGMAGQVYDYAALTTHRPYYVDAATARGYGSISTVLLISVSPAQAKAFDDYWASLTASPGSFNILGGNCSTRASGGFEAAHIYTGGIPGLDTPDHLYAHLCRVMAGKCWSSSGYVGFSKFGAGYMLHIDPP